MNVKIKPVNFLYGIHASNVVLLLAELVGHHDKLREILGKLLNSQNVNLDPEIDQDLRLVIEKLREDCELLKESIETAPQFHALSEFHNGPVFNQS